MDLRSGLPPPSCRHLFRFLGCLPCWASCWAQEESLPGEPGVRRRDSRLIAGGLVEAAGKNEVAQCVLLQGRGRVPKSGQNVDVVEAVPLSHRIHPRGVCLVEAVCFVLVALDTETIKGQRTNSRDRPRSGNECSGLLRTDGQGGEPGVGKNRRQGSRRQEWTGTARLKGAVGQGGDGLSTPSGSFMQPLRRVGKDSSPHFTDED